VRSQLSEYPRLLRLDLRRHNAAFLWGPRKVGKTTLLKQRYGAARYFDLLQSDLKTSLLLRPSLLREDVVANHYDLVVVDEVQKVPVLLDEVHWCLENTKTRFILCGFERSKGEARRSKPSRRPCLAIRALSADDERVG